MTNGLQKRDVFRSGITGMELKNFTFELWIRFHSKGFKSQNCSVFNISNAYSNGMYLEYKNNPAGTRGFLEFRLATGKHPVIVYAKGITPGIWYQVTCTYDEKNVCIYVDGKLKGKKAYSGSVLVPKAWWMKTGVKFLEARSPYFQVGGRPTSRKGYGRFDIGELAIYNRALPAAKIAEHYKAGENGKSPAEQIAEYNKLQDQIKKLSEIKISVPDKTWGYFVLGKPIPVKVSIPTTAGLKGKYDVVMDLVKLDGTKIIKKKLPVNVDGKNSASVSLNVKPPQCGVYFLDIKLIDSNGKLVMRIPEKYPFGIAPTPNNGPNNPMGLLAVKDAWTYGMPIRRIFVYPKGDSLKRVESYNTGFPGFRAFVCIQIPWLKKITKKNLAQVEKRTIEIANSLKGKVYAWEVSNEPNGKITPENYLAMLKVISKVLRKITPDVPIAAPGASPSGLPFIKKILQDGAGKYIDIVSFHNYQANPINQYRMKNTGHELQQMIKKYCKKKLPIWNSESGFFTLPRVGYHSMTWDEAKKSGFNYKETNGVKWCATSMPTAYEPEAAARISQAILLDMASGYRQYIKCQSPSLPGLELTNVSASPTLPGIALTALSTIIGDMKTVKEIPMPSRQDICLEITDTKGKRNAAIFTAKPGDLYFKSNRKKYSGMDVYGNPMQWTARANGMIVVKAGMAPVYIFDINDSFKPVEFLKLNIPKKLSDERTLEGTATITNPFAKTMKGTVTMVPPKGATVSPTNLKINLKPGACQKVKFELKSKQLKRREYEVGVEMVLNSGFKASASAPFTSQGAINKVLRTMKPVVLDGKLDEWANVPALTCDDKEGVVHGKPNLAELWLPQWRGKDDLSFSVKMLWRKRDAIYFLLQVRDNKVMPAPGDKRALAFKYDCLELFFDSRPYGKRGGTVSEGADQAIIIPSDSATAKPCKQWLVRSDKVHIGVECVSRKTADGYLIEGKITPNAKTDFKLLPGSQFYMDYIIDDIDDPAKPRKVVMAMDGTMDNSRTASNWGCYELSLKKVK